MSNQPAFNDLSYRQFLSEERLMGCRCRNCSSLYLPPKPVCTNCFSNDLEWIEMPSTGKLAAFTCITIGPPAMQKEGYNRKNPYCTGVVEIEKDIRVDARIEGVDPKKPEEIKIGMPMKAGYLHIEKDGVRNTILAFRPA
jgi:hypothetical protein